MSKRVQLISYIERGAFKAKAVIVREDRTMAETKSQYSRLVPLAMHDGHRMNLIQDIYHRTFYALHATGRGAYTIKPGIRDYIVKNIN